jgi:hypothetical protein
MKDLNQFLRTFDNVRIEDIMVKYLVENGIDSYDKLRELLDNDDSLSSVDKNHLENAMQDYFHGNLNLKKIPSVK